MKNFNTIDRLYGKDEWLTPPEIIKSLGEFDLDPCAPINRPWPTAKNHFTVEDNGLLREWFGRVWMNPPYGNVLINWLNKIALHGNGIALMFARTETVAFQKFVFPFADSVFFFSGRLTFYHVSGQVAKYNGGAPSCLVAYGENNSESINRSGLPGFHIPVNQVHVVLISSTWRVIVKTVLVRLNKPAELYKIYEQVEKLAPTKVRDNINYKAKIRQTVQLYFTRVTKATYKC